MATWVAVGLLEWVVGEWATRQFDLGSWLFSAGTLLTNLGLFTLVACAFWAVRITLSRTNELPLSAHESPD